MATHHPNRLHHRRWHGRPIWLLIGGILAAVGCSKGGTTSDGGKSTNAANPTSAADSTDPGKSSQAVVEEKKTQKEPWAPIDESLDVQALLSKKLPSDELDLGWIRLFDGHTLLGWKNAGDANWRIEEGALVADKGTPGLLCTTSRFSDYELKLEFLAAPNTNSGVFLRTPARPTDPGKDCYELNIAPPDNPFPTSSLVQRVKVEPEKVGELDLQEWHAFHALIDAEHVQIWIDGKPVVDYVDTTQLTSGLIGLQFREGPIRFRNICLRPILIDTILPAKDLSRWIVPEKSPAKFEVQEDGSLLIEGGKSHIELGQALGDFVMRWEAKTYGKQVNSGLFFRCIPGEELNGYECQINNDFVEDRRRPADWGMGGIFKRQPARALFSDDAAWAHITLVADGSHLATWVEGIQTVDWVDTREPHANPRIGRRNEAGSIMLQAHDPTCKVQIRNLSAMPLPETAPKGGPPKTEKP